MDRDPTFAEAMIAIGFPADFAGREPDATGLVDQVMARYDAVYAGPPQRTFATGLLLALVAQAEVYLAAEGQTRRSISLDDIRSDVDSQGRAAKQLILRTAAGELIGLRPLYTRLHNLVAGDMMRLGFPSAPGHATGAWTLFSHAIEDLLAATPEQRAAIAVRLWEILAELDRQRLDTGRPAAPRPFTLLLDTFEPRQAGEREGAQLQGMVYAYYRADAPNIDLDAGRSRAGSARTGRIGDLDGYSGDELVLTIEVKDIAITKSSVRNFEDWWKKLLAYPNATKVGVARSFSDEARTELEARGVAILDEEIMARTVALWDLGKQQLALRGFWFYLNRIERDPKIKARFDEWLESQGLTLWFSGVTDSSL